jgi:hypothetical protein
VCSLTNIEERQQSETEELPRVRQLYHGKTIEFAKERVQIQKFGIIHNQIMQFAAAILMISRYCQ